MVDCLASLMCQVETECVGRLRLLNAARLELESFDAGVGRFDSWLCGAESQLRIMQRSVGDLHKFRQQTIDLQVTHALTISRDRDITFKDCHYNAHALLSTPYACSKFLPRVCRLWLHLVAKLEIVRQNCVFYLQTVQIRIKVLKYAQSTTVSMLCY